MVIYLAKVVGHKKKATVSTKRGGRPKGDPGMDMGGIWGDMAGYARIWRDMRGYGGIRGGYAGIRG